jgi:hypothetical protein
VVSAERTADTTAATRDDDHLALKLHPGKIDELWQYKRATKGTS